MNFFTPADFENLDESYSVDLQCSRIANAKLKSEGVRVYSEDNDGWSLLRYLGTNNQALLVCIEPLAKAECEHEPFISNDPGRFGVFVCLNDPMKCRKCGVKLRAKWEAAE